jgi:ribonucleoside-diphosphate reductase beta chain
MTVALDETVLTGAGMEPGTLLVQTPADLFQRWLDLRWNPEAIDLSQDAQRWSQLDEPVRMQMRRTMMHFLAGEQLVTELLCPILYSRVPQEDERLYLGSQIADEAVHTAFFRRLTKLLFDFTGSIDQILPTASEPFRQVFAQLAEDVESVRLDRSDVVAWTQAVTTYHLVVEGFLGLAGQRALMQILKHAGGFPGFTAGMKGIMQDESRHIIYGVIALSRRVNEMPLLAHFITERLLTLAKPAMQVATGGWLRLAIPAGGPKSPSPLEQLSKRLAIIGVPAADIGDVLSTFRSSITTPVG